MATVVQILTSAAPESPMESFAEAKAVAGRGLEGDRYFNGRGTFSPQPSKPDFELTLIEKENVDTYARTSGHTFTAHDARRNLVTEGIALNDLVGQEFSIGHVRIRGIRLCEPCNYLAKKTHADVLRGLLHKGGLRAQVLTDGIIRVGDQIVAST